MQEYSDFPPLDLFKRVLTTSPECALLYASIWKLKPQSNRLSINKEDVKKLFLISITLFRNNMLSLGRLELINIKENSDTFVINFLEKAKQ